MKVVIFFIATLLITVLNPHIAYSIKEPFTIVRLRYYPKAQRSILLNNGVVVYHFEETRPVTEEEKIKRAEYFEKEWAKLEEKSKKSIPEMEKAVKEGTEEVKEEIKKRPHAMPLYPFFGIVPKFFSGVVKMGMEIAKVEGKRYFVNAPVVTRAGFVLEYPDGSKEEIILDLREEYGEEEWMRIPNDAVNIQASPDGRFLALETEKGGILIFEYDQNLRKFLHLARVEGQHPFGFSLDGKFMFVSLESKSHIRIDILPPPNWRDKRFVISPHRPIKEIRLNLGKNEFVKDVLLYDDNYLILLTWHKLYVYDIANERVYKEYKFSGHGGRSMIFGPFGDIFVAPMDRASVVKVNPRDWSFEYVVKENIFELEKKHGVNFLKLVSVSPDGRYVAALYDPGLIPPPNVKSWSGSSTEESRLFIWDVKERRVVYKFNERLETISGGFGYQSPAYFTNDWRYILLRIKENGNELLQLRWQ